MQRWFENYNSRHQGENSWFIAKQCGHASLKQINTVYSKYIPSARDGDKLEKAYEAVKVSSNVQTYPIKKVR